jgi:hypothetical protein
MAEPRAPAVDEEDRRVRIASMAMQGLLSKAASNAAPDSIVYRYGEEEGLTYADKIAGDAVAHADA